MPISTTPIISSTSMPLCSLKGGLSSLYPINTSLTNGASSTKTKKYAPKIPTPKAKSEMMECSKNFKAITSETLQPIALRVAISLFSSSPKPLAFSNMSKNSAQIEVIKSAKKSPLL